MFKIFKRKRLIEELDHQYFMLSICLREWVYWTEQYLTEESRYDKRFVLQKMHWASDECTVRQELIEDILKELR